MTEFIIGLAIGYVVGALYIILKDIKNMATLLQEIEKHNRDIGTATYRIEHRLNNYKGDETNDETRD